jgi:hypothetical protein
MAGEVGYLALTHVGDRDGYVSIYRAGSDRVALVGQAVHFESTTGRVIHEEPPPTPVMSVAEFLTGLHLQHFEHWLLRWLYVFGGLTGCVCIATGLIFFVGKRRQKHAVKGARGARIVDALAVTSITGMVVATLAVLVANRLLPVTLEGRAGWEESVFWVAWLLAFAHAAVRSAPIACAQLAPAWREQCYAIAALAPIAVLLNWATTGDHLVRTLLQAYYPVAGVDLTLLCCAFVALLVAGKLRRAESSTTAPHDAAIAGANAPEAAHG